MAPDPETVLTRLSRYESFWVLLSLLALYWASVEIRAHKAQLVTGGREFPFWMESAQRFRNIQYIAAGKKLPDPDRRIQWPDGYHPFQDTLIQEYLIGTLAGWISPESISAFTKSTTRWFYCLILLPIFWLLYAVTNHRIVSLVATAIYMMLPVTIDRSNGLYIYRENVMLPLLVTHLATFYIYLRYPKASCYIWVSGFFLLLCHLTWKVTNFYQLVVELFLLTLCVRQMPDSKTFRAVIALTLPPVMISLFVPVSLFYDRYWGGIHGAFTIAVVTFCTVARIRPLWIAHTRQRVILLLALFLTALFLLPGALHYDHAWETLWAKIQFLDQKPHDPSLLNFHPRHYWTGNYRSPSLIETIHNFAVPSLFAIAAIAIRRKQLWSTFADFFLLLALITFVVAFALFTKYSTFLAIFLSPFVATGLVETYWIFRSRLLLASLLMILTLFSITLSAWTAVGLQNLFSPKPPDEHYGGIVHTPQAIEELNQWIQQNTTPSDPILAGFAISPYICTYWNRPTLLHCFFEGPGLDRYSEFVNALFNNPSSFQQFLKKYQGRFFLYESHFLMRIDRWMSYRYVANKLRLSGKEAAYLFHYYPEKTGMLLVFQNHYFRVYALPQQNSSIKPRILYSPLFDTQVPGAQINQPLQQGSQLLYALLKSEQIAELASHYENSSQPQQALALYLSAWHECPYNIEISRKLIQLLTRTNRKELLDQFLQKAQTKLGTDFLEKHSLLTHQTEKEKSYFK